MKNNNLNYVKIPREIIYDKDLSSKRVIIFSYLCARRSLDDTVAFSTTELCHWSKLKPNYRNGKINQKYYEVLLLLSHYGYFESCPDFEKCLKENTNSVKYQQVQLNIEKFDVPDSFGIIYFDELDKILNFKEELKGKDIDLARMSSAYILLLLSYIRVNLNRIEDKPLLNTFCSLDSKDPLKAEILTNIGQKYHANELAALLSGWSDYNKMLQDYSEGDGSAFEESQKSANNLEGSLNKLSNTWTSTINNIANSSELTTAVKGLNGVLTVVNKITSALGGFGTIATTASGILGAKGLGLT